uniref:Uncharacterized protein n=1 Tax=Pyrodinium bahamense TaxID=73915 RepID=A0A7S0AUU7_9DINO
MGVSSCSQAPLAWGMCGERGGPPSLASAGSVGAVGVQPMAEMLMKWESEVTHNKKCADISPDSLSTEDLDDMVGFVESVRSELREQHRLNRRLDRGGAVGI